MYIQTEPSRYFHSNFINLCPFYRSVPFPLQLVSQLQKGSLQLEEPSIFLCCTNSFYSSDEDSTSDLQEHRTFFHPYWLTLCCSPLCWNDADNCSREKDLSMNMLLNSIMPICLLINASDTNFSSQS